MFLINAFESISIFQKCFAALYISFPLPTSSARSFISLVSLCIAAHRTRFTSLSGILLTSNTSLSNIRLKPNEDVESGRELCIEIN
jgi:hypothetical protein